MASNIYSSFLASIVTAPVVIYHFYVFSNYSVPMNLLAVPIMSFILMPLAIIAMIAMPFGLDVLPLWLMGKFIGIIIYLADFFTHLPGSLTYFGYISPLSLRIFLFGFFWVCLWQTSFRLWRFILIFISGMLMFATKRPEIIIDVDNKIIGVKSHEKLEIITEKISAFYQQYWANWFGLKDAIVINENILQHNYNFKTDSGKSIAINFVAKKALEGDIRLDLYKNNHLHKTKHHGLISITRDQLE